VSRTIRRTKAKKYHSRFEKDYTHYIPEVWDGREQGIRGVNRIKDFPLLPLEGKEFQIAYWKYHTDNGLAIFGWEDAYEYPYEVDERSKRGTFKCEIHKWLRNPEHEIQYSRFKKIWDYC
jgi:hypothetical protein